MYWPLRASLVRVSTSLRSVEGPWRKMMDTGCMLLVNRSQENSVTRNTYAGGVVGGEGDRVSLAVSDRVGHVGEGQNGGLGSRKRSESAEKKSLGEHLELWSRGGCWCWKVETSRDDSGSEGSTERTWTSMTLDAKRQE